MSVLKGNQCYGLSSRTLCNGANVSIFHVKLTDSAARAIDTFQNIKNQLSQPTICFNQDQQRITIPCSENNEDGRTFTFALTNIAQDNPNGSFDCIKQLGRSTAEEQLSCMGEIQKRITVNATDDSYQKALKNFDKVKVETRKKATIVIKDGGRMQKKRITVRVPSPALVNLAKPRPGGLGRPGASTPRPKKKTPCASDIKGVGLASSSPLRERLIHLLAVRPYRCPELILRLQKDGLVEQERDMLDTVLLEVGQFSGRDNTYVLKDRLYSELQKDWPGYTTGDKQLLRRILVRRLFKPHMNLLCVPETQVSPLRDTPNSSPARPPNHSLTEECTQNTPAAKKPRISHASGREAGDPSTPHPGSCDRLEGGNVSARPRNNDDDNNNNRGHSLTPGRPRGSFSNVYEKEECAAKTRQPDPSSSPTPTQSSPSPPLPRSLPRASFAAARREDRRAKKSGKSKHGEPEKVRSKDEKERKRELDPEDLKSKVPSDCTDTSGMLYDSSVLQADEPMTDYQSAYTVICSHDQRLSYKQDFNKEYCEYRRLHARIDSVTCQFMELNAQLKRLRHGSNKYKTIRNQILQVYRKIKKSNPNYSQEKIRCEHLHNKLAHIKKLISDYDRQQFSP